MTGRALVAVLAVSFAPLTARAQTSTASYSEYRVDAIVGNGNAAQVGAGVTLPMGTYVRLGLIGAAGAIWRDGGSAFSGRTDAIARFTFDPLREVPIALSLGGGVTVPIEARRRVRPLLAAVIDLEGRKRGRFTPALQVGLGGGARLGVLLRTSPAARR